MPNTSTVRVQGLKELQRDLKKMRSDLGKELKAELRSVAEPVRQTAEQLAVANLPNIGPAWSRMRIGITTSVVYVAPRTRRKLGSPRPNLAQLLMDRSMQPALDQHEQGIESALEVMLDRLGEKNGF